MILSNDEALAKKFNSAVFPGMQGGPLMHVIAAKAVAFAEALRPDFKAVRGTGGGERPGDGRRADGAWATSSSPAAPTPIWCWSTCVAAG